MKMSNGWRRRFLRSLLLLAVVAGYGSLTGCIHVGDPHHHDHDDWHDDHHDHW